MEQLLISPLSLCANAHLGQWCPKNWSHCLWLVSGFTEEVQPIPQVQSGHCVSTRNRPVHSHYCCCCCCHDWCNKWEHFELLWLGLSNKSKHGLLLMLYISGAWQGNLLPGCNLKSNSVYFIWFKLFMQHTFFSKLYNRSISPQDCCTIFPNTSGRENLLILYLIVAIQQWNILNYKLNSGIKEVQRFWQEILLSELDHMGPCQSYTLLGIIETFKKHFDYIDCQ